MALITKVKVIRLESSWSRGGGIQVGIFFLPTFPSHHWYFMLLSHLLKRKEVISSSPNIVSPILWIRNCSGFARHLSCLFCTVHSGSIRYLACLYTIPCSYLADFTTCTYFSIPYMGDYNISLCLPLRDCMFFLYLCLSVLQNAYKGIFN